MKSSTYYFHLKTKMFADFQICISVTLTFEFKSHIFKVTYISQSHISLKTTNSYLENGNTYIARSNIYINI